MPFIRTSRIGKVKKITSQGDGSEIILKLDETPVEITISLTKNVMENLNLKPGSPANAVFFSPWPNISPNTGQKIATVQRSQDAMWVTILYGHATP